MKKLFSFLVLSVLVACNTPEDHATRQGNNDTDQSTADSTLKKSMYELMQDNMEWMMSVKPSGAADIDFAALMKKHHQGAVIMSEVLLHEGTNPEIKKIAQQIIADQQKEIATFDSLITANKATGTDSSFFKKSMEDMHHMSLKEEKSNVDKEFLQMMIPHHEGAIIMSKTYLSNGAKDARLKAIANNIIKTQQEEIDIFRQILLGIKEL